jgi:hypothetical protein
VTYNIVVKVMDDRRAKFKKGRNHRNWSEADAYVASVYRGLKHGESKRVAYEVENIYSGIIIPWVFGSFTITKDDKTRYEDGSFKALVLEVQYPEYADLIGTCLS